MEFTKLVELMQQDICLNTLYYLFAILVAFDVLTGMIKAFKQGRIKSRTMRDGLIASLGELLLLLLGVIINILIPIQPVSFVVYVGVVAMCWKEFYSIIENLMEIGVIFPRFISRGMDVFNSKVEGE